MFEGFSIKNYSSLGAMTTYQSGSTRGLLHQVVGLVSSSIIPLVGAIQYPMIEFSVDDSETYVVFIPSGVTLLYNLSNLAN